MLAYLLHKPGKIQAFIGGARRKKLCNWLLTGTTSKKENIAVVMGGLP